MEKLIIIRGPSGAGKSTVARVLHQRSDRPTLLVGEDQFRKLFNDHRQPNHKVSRQLSNYALRLGLQNGYDVIFEGILGVKKNPDAFKILEDHPNENYFFYLDVAYDETLRRHEMRPERTEFEPEAMARWWEYASPTGHPSETVIPGDSSLEDTMRTIARVAGLNLSKPA